MMLGPEVEFFALWLFNTALALQGTSDNLCPNALRINHRNLYVVNSSVFCIRWINLKIICVPLEERTNLTLSREPLERPKYRYSCRPVSYKNLLTLSLSRLESIITYNGMNREMFLFYLWRIYLRDECVFPRTGSLLLEVLKFKIKVVLTFTNENV